MFDANDGAHKTTRTYTANIIAQNEYIKSIIISSGASPKAYVMSSYKTSAVSCTGNQVFAFDLLSVTNVIWAKRTSNGC